MSHACSGRGSAVEHILCAQLEEGGDAYLCAPAPPAAFRDKFKALQITAETKEVSLKKSKPAIDLLVAKGELQAEVHRAAEEKREVNTAAAWHGFITDISAFPKTKEVTLLWSARTREGGWELRANEFNLSRFRNV